MTIDQIRAILWSKHQYGLGGSFYVGTCDIVQRVQTADSGGLISETLSPIQTTVPCRLVEIKQKTVNADVSATVQRNFTLYLRDCVIILDNYLFTNFFGLDLVDPNALYEQVMETERSKSAGSGGLFMYTIKGLKRIDKNG